MSIFEKLKAEQEAKRKQTAEHSEVKVEPSPFPQQVASPAPPPTEKPILIAAATPEAVKIIEAQKVAEKVVEKVEAASILPSQPSATSPPSHIAVQTSPIVKEPIIKSKLWEGTEGKNAVKEEKGIGIMIYGDKGVGKTTDAFSLIDLNPEYTIACLSFDKKGQKIKDTIFHGNSRIQVFDPLKYFSADTDEELLQTSVDTFDYMMWLLKEGDIFIMKPHFIMIDGLEIFKERMEYKMRASQHLQPYEVFTNGWAYWHQRTSFMNAIDAECKRQAKIGVIYSSYMVYKQVKDKVTGEVTLTEPAWSGNVKSETDIVMRAESKKANNGGTDFYVRVESSKVASVPTGREKLIGNIDTEGNVNVIGFKTLLAKGKTLV